MLVLELCLDSCRLPPTVPRTKIKSEGNILHFDVTMTLLFGLDPVKFIKLPTFKGWFVKNHEQRFYDKKNSPRK